VKGRDDIAFPRQASVLDREAKGPRLKLHPNPGDVREILERDVRDPIAALTFNAGQTLRGETRQRFPQRAGAGVVPFPQFVDPQLRARQ
jgi:hypothetical protein